MDQEMLDRQNFCFPVFLIPMTLNHRSRSLMRSLEHQLNEMELAACFGYLKELDVQKSVRRGVYG